MSKYSYHSACPQYKHKTYGQQMFVVTHKMKLFKDFHLDVATFLLSTKQDLKWNSV